MKGHSSRRNQQPPGWKRSQDHHNDDLRIARNPLSEDSRGFKSKMQTAERREHELYTNMRTALRKEHNFGYSSGLVSAAMGTTSSPGHSGESAYEVPCNSSIGKRRAGRTGHSRGILKQVDHCATGDRLRKLMVG